jgi:hypothetical protein
MHPHRGTILVCSGASYQRQRVLQSLAYLSSPAASGVEVAAGATGTAAAPVAEVLDAWQAPPVGVVMYRHVGVHGVHLSLYQHGCATISRGSPDSGPAVYGLGTAALTVVKTSCCGAAATRRPGY